MELKLNNIYHMDCLEGMRQLESNVVDVSFTSPPYNDKGGENADVRDGENHKKYLHVEYRDDWYEWQVQIIDEMLRLSKKYVLYNVQALQGNRHNVYKLIGHYADRIHDIIMWYKPNGVPCGTPNKISNRYEFLLILKCDGVKGVSVNSKFSTNVYVNPTNSNREFSDIHRAVMSKSFADKVIEEFTQVGDVVLDPFMGCGTTAVSCVERGRKYVGFEIVQEYVDAANERIIKTSNCTPSQGTPTHSNSKVNISSLFD